MFSIDIPSFLIGAGLVTIIWLLYNVFKRPVKPIVLHEKLRPAGSRKEDNGVFVEERKKRVTHIDGKLHWREEKWLERNVKKP